MKVIVAGSRNITDMDAVVYAISCSGLDISELVCGKARGVDMLGARWAEEHGVKVTYFPADWKKHGRKAGPLRNRKMAEYADALIAVWDGKSKGTCNMINQAIGKNLPTYVYDWLPKTFEGHVEAGLMKAAKDFRRIDKEYGKNK